MPLSVDQNDVKGRKNCMQKEMGQISSALLLHVYIEAQFYLFIAMH